MATVALPRIAFDKLLSDERRELATKASAKLGYHRLALAISAPSALLFALRELDIQPLSWNAVQSYKKSQEHVGWYSGSLWTLLWTIQFVVCGTTALCTRIMVDKPSGAIIAMVVALGVAAAWGFFAALGWGLMGENFGHGNRTLKVWQATRLSEYSGVIPEHVLAKALSIQEKSPTTEFSIEYLTQTQEHNPRPEPLPDPFLVARLGNEAYYIDQWDEAKYENKL